LVHLSNAIFYLGDKMQFRLPDGGGIGEGGKVAGGVRTEKPSRY